MRSILLIACLSFLKSVFAVSTPFGCEHKDGVFTCGFKNSIPIKATGFDPPPQRVLVNEVNGKINSASFTDFDKINISTFDPNYSPSLTIACLQGGSSVLSLDNTSFQGMDYFQEVRIINCQLNAVPEGAFANLGTLNYLSFEGGVIDNLDTNAFIGVSIQKGKNIPNPKGEFSLVNTKLAEGGLNLGVLDPFKDASVLTLNNCRIQVMDKKLFTQMRYLTRINLDNNPFTYIKENIFAGLESLRVVSMDNIPWTCTCPALWFLQYAADQGINLQGDMVCSRPMDYNRRALKTYQRLKCGKTVTQPCPLNTFPLSGVCLSWLHITSFTLSVISLVVVLACIFFTIRNRRDIFKKTSNRAVVRSVNGHRAAAKRITPQI